VIKFVSDLRQFGGFLRVLRFPPPIKTDRHDITEVLLKMALNTVKKQNKQPFVRFLLVIALSFGRLTASDEPFCIFKPFF
jgi:hypothetical protein